MKIYIQTDIEGVAGFCFFENRENPNYENILHRQRMYRLLTNEVNAAVKAAFDSGADEVFVNDNHGTGYNIIFEELDPRCRIIHGRNFSSNVWLPKLDSSIDAMVLIGMHAMGGTPNSITPHSRWEINDGQMYLSECTMACALAGDLGVPAVMLSGDDKICSETRDKIPGIVSVEVKEALSAFQACSLVPSRACQLIYEGVMQGIARRHTLRPFVVPGPVRLNLLDSKGHVPPLERMGDTIEADSITEAFNKFERNMSWTPGSIELPDGFVFP